MDADTLQITLKTHLTEMRKRLDQAVALGRAAESCAETGSIAAAVEIANDVEQLVYEVNTLLNAASLMNRIYRD